MEAFTWNLYACGINHKSADLEEREPLQIGHDDMAKASSILVNLDGIRESVLISTCNRNEFYFVVDKEIEPLEIVQIFYQNFNEYDISDLKDKFYVHKDHEAANHLFRVAAGVDSMVIGENQIISQIREGYRSACSIKSAGKVIHRLFHQAFRIGKQVRTSTELGKGACSVSGATIDMLKARLSEHEDPKILFIGLNQMIKLAATGLLKLGYDKFIFANRTESRAREFAETYKVPSYSLESLPQLLREADVVLTCTGSEEPVITHEMLAERERSNTKKLVIADMAIPRDVAPNGTYHNIDIYNLEDVKEHVRDAQKHRQEEIPKAEELIAHRLEQFVYWFDHVRLEPMGDGLGDAFEQVRLEEIRHHLSEFPEEYRDSIDDITRHLIEKLLHVHERFESQKK